jgi:ribonuclease HI
MSRSRKQIVAYCDGAFRLQPRGSAGFVLYTGEEKIAERSEPLSGFGVTASVCEYVALCRLLEFLIQRELTDRKILIRADFKAMIDHMLGRAPVRSRRLEPLYMKAQEFAAQFEHLEFEWVPRLLNNGADQVVRRWFII